MNIDSIKRKIILAVVIIVSFGFIMFEFYDYNISSLRAVEELKERSEIKAARLAENLTLPLWEIDKQWIEKVIETEMRDKQTYAVLVYTDGKLFAGKQRDAGWQVVDSSHAFAGDFIENHEHIMHDGEEIGLVKLFISKRFMQEKINERLQREVIVLLLLALFIASVLVVLLNRIVVQRLQAILHASQAIAANDYSFELHVKHNDEIAKLGDGINSMKERIQLRESALKKSESRFRRLAQQISIPIAYVLESGEFDFVNERFSKTFGYTHEDMPTISQWWELAYPDEAYREWVQANWQAACQRAVDLDVDIKPHEYNVTCKNGEVRIVEISGVFLGKDLLATCIDLTERKKAEEKVRRYSQAMEQSGEAIVIADRAGVIEHINPSYTLITGYAEAEAIGKKTSILKSDRQDEKFYAKLWNTIAGGQTWQGKIVNRKKSGECYPAMLTISPIRDEKGKITHFIGIQQNLEKFEEMEAQFYQSQKMEAVGTLVGGIAHDFNNTLAGITGNLYLAKKAAKSLPDVVERLVSVEKLSFSAAATIQQLLTFSRKGIVQMNPLSITTFLKETVKLQKVSLPENINFQLQISDADLQIKGDINQLQQVLMNLINNAFDAVQNQDNPSICVKLDRFYADASFFKGYSDIEEGEYACLSVIDNGMGIDPVHLQHIFEPFFTTKEPGRGTGLGLAMAYGSVKTHGGVIDVKSSQHEPSGTTVRLYFPLLSSGQVVALGASDDKIINGDGETILLVDDNDTVLETGCDVLEGLGYRVLTASDGVMAVEMYHSHGDEIDLLILDVVMPRLGGVEALQEIREINPHVKAMFATGYDKLSTLGVRKSEITEKVISKPFAVSKLSQMIREILEQA